MESCFDEHQKGTEDESIQGVIKKSVELAKSIKDEQQQLFALSAILVVTDKSIDKDCVISNPIDFRCTGFHLRLLTKLTA
jgi:hypothetical protein